jgi:AcrR family transcriptional regulator
VSGDAADAPTEGWQQRALDRTRPRARKRALERGAHFLATALELLEETGGVDFTVQTLVDRSGLSLRSFYQHFGGKDELLLALYEDLMVKLTARMRAEVMREDDPLDRIERFCTSFMDRSARSQSAGGRALSVYHLGLAVDRPADYREALQPQFTLLQELIQGGVDANVVRDDLSAAQVTDLLSSTLMAVAQIGMFGTATPGEDLSPQDVWAWCRSAVLPPSPDRRRLTPARRTRR